MKLLEFINEYNTGKSFCNLVGDGSISSWAFLIQSLVARAPWTVTLWRGEVVKRNTLRLDYKLRSGKQKFGVFQCRDGKPQLTFWNGDVSRVQLKSWGRACLGSHPTLREPAKKKWVALESRWWSSPAVGLIPSPWKVRALSEVHKYSYASHINMDFFFLLTVALALVGYLEENCRIWSCLPVGSDFSICCASPSTEAGLMLPRILACETQCSRVRVTLTYCRNPCSVWYPSYCL